VLVMGGGGGGGGDYGKEPNDKEEGKGIRRDAMM